MKIAVIDGQGGGIGKAIVDRLRRTCNEELEIIALGTNSLATSMMLKAGATGENAIVYNSTRVDMILGSVGIVCANSFLGELTPKMAEAIAESSVKKVLIPLNKCNVLVVGIENKSLPHYIEDVVEIVKNYGGR